MSTNPLPSRISIKTEFGSFDKALLNSPVLSVNKKQLISSLDIEHTVTDSNLYGVYGETEDQLFDSDETIGKTGVVSNPDSVVNSAAKLLQLAMSDRKILLESDTDILPASFRLPNNSSEVSFYSTEKTRALVDDILSGEHFTASAATESDQANILSGVYVASLKNTGNGVCEAAERLVDVLQR